LTSQREVSINAKDKITGLSIAERQLVEIAKALSINAKVVIMDEPTSALSISESEELFMNSKAIEESLLRLAKFDLILKFYKLYK